MKIDKELIEHIASLARLKLTEKEIEKFLPQLKEILNAFSKLDEVNTDNTQPSFHPVELKNMMREDRIKPSLTQEQALSNSKENKDNYFKGPMAI
ncbi:MAG: Asp-tRNA(Asn)/Glu-tRNA(Gln) amidotransferase subunit GatC [Nanoarchaeota archaeon]|nr:Asp-tRNA(Asn)/Glu-tRNA(Gln) amidotransferase subunit GatC [Nanoarchaeota archaeon]MBU1004610.1 Asp-tRNA(Asn)/Glu-tRNA(Gln) amidotransferase subunit GatC [Nanoarchaeota archaeon]MBU1945526.1 Asp-tRNA(Asn)/Glu-tRNA(Gln) amidotransferase subunit GatC [Nanoarchaeota archaeon]